MIGRPAPPFSLTASDGKTYTLESCAGKPVVLVFYPMDNTPGCNKQLSALRDDKAKFDRAGALIFGVNPAGVDSHQKFCDGFGFGFPLLSDPGLKMAETYGAARGTYNQRTVVVISPDGVVKFHRHGMPTDDEILEAIR
ncbi:MAG TPA: peroxiredoxin [Planctomycetota bacterium]|nr:peroxiredoxin [Planctomycetota bacterium]